MLHISNHGKDILFVFTQLESEETRSEITSGPKSVLFSLPWSAGQKKTRYNKVNDLKSHRNLDQEKILYIVGFNFLIFRDGKAETLGG